VHKLEEMGYKLGAKPVGGRVRADEGVLADRKKDIYDEDIEALVVLMRKSAFT